MQRVQSCTFSVRKVCFSRLSTLLAGGAPNPPLDQRRPLAPPASNIGHPEDMKMTILGMASLSSLAMAAALAGCSSGTYGTGKHASQLSNTDLAPSKVDYAPNQSAPRTIGRVVTTRAGAT